ncbi:MAG: hypothetical protein A3J48_00955 [Candidatus Doudnabacteria bacterium RIFCSPHIGHO2_02_FULL_46_11]|uniref:Uncharacterized protein n=1 Tax=Candidatus Doudnabacteria bacterium RIFCSPHIGHO2_02_FULL_46_11 TaxID=1817832 RepID=A0A1F5P8B0_9BACT|nr:MAG: hypothetical protein A3J48_00955 [Candidatus Doudnabacteria bacterium RIFCSPHIGHO2_02_FULL_46_11]
MNIKTIIKTIIWSLAAFILAFGLSFSLNNGWFKPETKDTPKNPQSLLLSNIEAYDLALGEARDWQKDAALAQMSALTNTTDEYGHSDNWQALFVSEKKSGRGYSVIIENRKISKTEEIPFVGTGGALPENIITSEEAIAYVRSLAGYQSQTVLGVEMVYGPNGEEWYWGVKTNKGTVTVKAKR